MNRNILFQCMMIYIFLTNIYIVAITINATIIIDTENTTIKVVGNRGVIHLLNNSLKLIFKELYVIKVPTTD